MHRQLQKIVDESESRSEAEDKVDTLLSNKGKEAVDNWSNAAKELIESKFPIPKPKESTDGQ